MKVTWNKINTDMVEILIFEEIIPISNEILRILSNKNDNDKNKGINENIKREYSKNSIALTNLKKNYKSEESEMKFVVINFQICIENEITKSRLLISTRENITFTINKLCFNEKEKNFIMKLKIQDFIFFIPPSNSLNSGHAINWIRISENNNLYLPQEQFTPIAKFQNILLNVEEIT